MSDFALLSSDVMNVKMASKLDMDSNGYRLVVLSAFNYASRGGNKPFYKHTKELDHLFSANGKLKIRARERNLYGEWGHPTIQPGESVPNFVNRFREVTEKHMSHHIRDVFLRPGKDEHGNPVVLAMGWVKPFGPYAHCLEQAFTNDEQNCSFSIRSASRRYNREGPDGNMRLEKEIYEVFAWDYVNLPGHAIATKYHTPAEGKELDTENMADVESPEMAELLAEEFSLSDLQKAEAVADHLCAVTGIENNTAVSTTMIKTALGWEKVEVHKMHATDW